MSKGYRTPWAMYFFAAVVLVPTILGFANKFMDLILIVQGDDEGAFAITPIVNYLFATAGFVCLLIWSATQGAFDDLDQPSVAMFENEKRLDAEESGAVTTSTSQAAV